MPDLRVVWRYLLPDVQRHLPNAMQHLPRRRYLRDVPDLPDTVRNVRDVPDAVRHLPNVPDMPNAVRTADLRHVPDTVRPADVCHVPNPLRDLRYVCQHMPDPLRRYLRRYLLHLPGRHLPGLYACHLRP